MTRWCAQSPRFWLTGTILQAIAKFLNQDLFAGHLVGVHSLGHTYRCGDVDKEGVAIYTHYLQERVGHNVHNFTVPPHQESPESKGNEPSVRINRCCCYGYWKYDKRFHILIRIPARIKHVEVFSLKTRKLALKLVSIYRELCIYVQFTPTTLPTLTVSLKVMTPESIIMTF